MADDVAGLVERLDNLGKRREMEGIYTDQNICEAAASTIRALAREKAAAVGLAQGSGAIADQQRARAEAAEAKVTEQAAEIERLREAVVGWDRHAMEMQDLAGAAEAKLRDADAVIQRLNSGDELQAIMAAHNDALAKLRDAVEVIRKLMQHEPDHADAIWQDARAFLATMEKPHD